MTFQNMHRNTLYKLLFLCLTYLSFMELSAQESIEKQFKETFNAQDLQSLKIANKHGDVHLFSWDKPTLLVQVVIKVTRKKMEQAQAVLNRISSKNILLGSELKVTSEIQPSSGGLFNRTIPKIKHKSDQISIDYHIYVPKHIRVTCNNAYGNIYVLDFLKSFKGTVEHGDMSILSTLDNPNLTIKYGRLDAFELNNASLDVVDADVAIDNATSITINSNGSEMNLGNIKKLNLQSNKDVITMDAIDDIEGTIKFSTIKFRAISGKVSLNLNLAEVRLLRFTSPIIDVDFIQQNSTIYINISQTSFAFTAHLEQGVLRIPKSMTGIKSQLKDSKKRIREIHASYKTEEGKLHITGFKGQIILKEL